MNETAKHVVTQQHQIKRLLGYGSVLTNSLVVETEDSTPLVQKPADGHYPERLPCTSQPISLRSILLIS
jgi:hypothetical protein